MFYVNKKEYDRAVEETGPGKSFVEVMKNLDIMDIQPLPMTDKTLNSLKMRELQEENYVFTYDFEGRFRR